MPRRRHALGRLCVCVCVCVNVYVYVYVYVYSLILELYDQFSRNVV